MRRRDFLTGIAVSATAWPLAARAQQPVLPLIGFLSGRSQDEAKGDTAAFLQVSLLKMSTGPSEAGDFYEPAVP